MEQQKQKNEELQKKLQETAALQDPWDTCALSCAGITLDVLLVSGFLRNHILNHHISFCKDSKLASVWKDVKDYTQSFLFSIQYITSIYQLLQWLMLREEEVAKKREETEDLQKKLQEASAMQAGFLALTWLNDFSSRSSCIYSMDMYGQLTGLVRVFFEVFQSKTIDSG